VKHPDSLEMLVVPDENGHRLLQRERVLKDPWKQACHDRPPSPDRNERDPHVWSNGRDGMPGGDDDVDGRTMDLRRTRQLCPVRSSRIHASLGLCSTDQRSRENMTTGHEHHR
jgi:Type II secretion system (T2SS), protein G